MTEYDSMAASQRKWMVFLLAILAIGSGATPFPRVFLGLLLGSIASFFNLWLLQRKVKSFGEAVAGSGTTLSLGTFSRMIAAILVMVIALRFEGIFHIYSVVIGLASSYLVMLISFFVRASKEAKKSQADREC